MGSVPQNAQKQIQRKKKKIQINSLKLLYVRSYQRKPVCGSSSVQVYYRLAPGYGTDLTWIDTEGCDFFLARMSSFVFQLCGSGGHRTSFGLRKRGDHEGIGRVTHWLCGTAPAALHHPIEKVESGAFSRRFQIPLSLAGVQWRWVWRRITLMYCNLPAHAHKLAISPQLSSRVGNASVNELVNEL